MTVEILGTTEMFEVGRVHFVTSSVTAKASRNFLTPRVGKMLLILFVGWVLVVYQTASYFPEKTKRTQVLARRSHFVGFLFTVVLFVSYFFPQMHNRQHVTMLRFTPLPFFSSLYGEYVVRYFPSWMVFFPFCFG